jgi:hypothetical protein
MAGHIYGITAGEGELLGYVRECTTCSLRLGADLSRYSYFDEGPAQDLEGLVARTFPNVREQFADRLALENQIQKQPSALTDKTRQQFLMEPFLLLNSTVEQCFAGKLPLDWPSGLSGLATILGTVGLFALVFATHDNGIKDRLLLAVLMVFGLGTAVTLALLYLRPHRYVRTKVLPFLAKSLKPLQPTTQELTDCLERCARQRLQIGRRFKPQQISARMEIAAGLSA